MRHLFYSHTVIRFFAIYEKMSLLDLVYSGAFCIFSVGLLFFTFRLFN